MRRKKKWLRQYSFFLLVAALAVMVTPLAAGWGEEDPRPLIILGSCLWFGILGAVAVSLRIGIARRKDPDFPVAKSRWKYLGLVRFFKNSNALIADVGMILSLIVSAIFELCDGNQTMEFVFLGILVFTFGMHCMLNDLNYLYINHKRKKEGTSYEK